MRVEVDFGLCEANAVCTALAPDVFVLDDEDVLTVLTPDIAPELESQVDDAIRQCPRQAIQTRE